MWPNGPNYNGIHHIGFQIDDMEEATHKLEAPGDSRSTSVRASTPAPAPPRPQL